MKRYRQAKLASLNMDRTQIVQGERETTFICSAQTLLRSHDALGERQGVGDAGFAVSEQCFDQEIGRAGHLGRAWSVSRLDILEKTPRLLLPFLVGAAIDRASDTL